MTTWPSSTAVANSGRCSVTSSRLLMGGAMHCRYFLILLGLVYLGTTLPVQAQPPAGPERVLSPSHAMFTELLLSGGPGKNGMPAIDSPKFSDAREDRKSTRLNSTHTQISLYL